MPESLGEEIRKIDGVKNVDSLRNYPTSRPAISQILLCIRGFTDKDNLPLVLKEGTIGRRAPRTVAGRGGHRHGAGQSLGKEAGR